MWKKALLYKKNTIDDPILKHCIVFIIMFFHFWRETHRPGMTSESPNNTQQRLKFELILKAFSGLHCSFYLENQWFNPTFKNQSGSTGSVLFMINHRDTRSRFNADADDVLLTWKRRRVSTGKLRHYIKCSSFASFTIFQEANFFSCISTFKYFQWMWNPFRGVFGTLSKI